MSEKTSSGKLTMFLIALCFFGPMALAMWMYFSGQEVKLGANHGELLEPLVNITEVIPGSPALDTGERQWLLIYSNDATCDEACREALYTQRQSHKMLGREMDRLGRVFLHGEQAPDTLFLAEQHADIHTGIDAELTALLASRLPQSASAGGYFLVDPNGYLVLYFPPEINPKQMVADIKRLFKISQIG